MSPRHQVSRAAIELIKRFEGYRRKAAQLPDGRWTIGYGHTLTARRGAEVSEADAEALLLYDMMGVASAVAEVVYADLNANQFDALCAFAYSIGLEAFRTSEVLKRVNEGAFIQAAFALELWRKADFQGERIVVDALVRRRAAEKLFFLTPPDGAWRPAPSALLRPQLDADAANTAPHAAAVTVAAALQGDLAQVTRDEAPAVAEAAGARAEALYAEEVGEVAEFAPETEPQAAAPAPAEADTPRVLIDDTAPYEFISAPVQPIEDDSRGLLGVVSLVLIGAIFLAGGIYWALNGQPIARETMFTPLLVGWLAGVAGVGFLATAVFLLLQGVTRAAERRPPN